MSMYNQVNRKKTYILNRIIEEKIVPEYYTYIDSNGNEQKYGGILSRSNSGIYGKSIERHKVLLTYHPEVKNVVGIKEHYTYFDTYGNEFLYEGKVDFDEKTNTYTGVYEDIVINNTIIDIFEEK